MGGNGKAILSLALIVSVVSISWIGFKKLSEQQASSAIEADQIPASNHNLGDKELTSASANNQPREDRGDFDVFQHPDADVERHLSDWLVNDYVKNPSHSEHHVRSRLVRINTKEFFDRARTSHEQSAGLPKEIQHASDILMTPFPGVSYRARVTAYYVGRDGTTVINGRIVDDVDGETGVIYFVVSPSGTVLGRVETESDLFRVSLSPLTMTGVVSELDGDQVRRSMRVD